MAFEAVSKVSTYNTSWWKPENVGDFAQGVLVDKEVSTNKFNPFEETSYRLVQDDGNHIIVKGRSKSDRNNPASLRVNYDLEKLPFGSYVRVQYMGDKPSKNKGFAAFKLIQVFEDKDKAADGAKVLEDYKKVDEGVAIDEIPF